MSKNGYDRYLDRQFGMSGSFFMALFEAIMRADSKNTEKIRLGFPEEVDAYLTWTRIGKDAFLDKCSQDNPILLEVRANKRIL